MKRKFSYQFLKKDGVAPSLFSLSNVITDLKSRTDERKKTDTGIFEKLGTIAIVESVKGSNAIEGIVATAERIKEIVEKDAAPLGHNEEEIAGYHDAIVFVSEHYEDLDLNEETVKEIHRLLTARHHGYRGGVYKKANNLIAEKNEDGDIVRVLFEPVPAKETEEAMKAWFFAYASARDDSEIHPLLLIPCVIVDFLSIHPFSDGNGRVSRLLTLLLLYKAGYDVGKYLSFEGMIDKFRFNYYEALEKSQRGWNDNANTYEPFITFTFQILYQCYKEMNRRLVVIEGGKKGKASRVEAIILGSIVPLSKADIAEFAPDVSVTTIEAALSKLQKQGKIKKIGTFKNARYVKAR